MTNIGKYAKSELALLKKMSVGNHPDEWPIVVEFEKEIIALCERLGKSGQSGGSAPYVASAIADAVKKLCMFTPISPVFGAENEWCSDKFDGETRQNNRLSSLFLDSENTAYYLNAIVWKDGNNTFTGWVDGVSSHQAVKSFPFSPKTFYIDVVPVDYDEQLHQGINYYEDGDRKYFYRIKDKDAQLQKVFKHYNEYKRK